MDFAFNDSFVSRMRANFSPMCTGLDYFYKFVLDEASNLTIHFVI